MVRQPEHIYDELLVLDCQRGDQAALKELIGRWQKRLGRFALRLTGDRDAASDALQESWMAIVRGIGRLDDPSSFRAWAYRIVANKCADWIRKNKRRRDLTEQMTIESEGLVVESAEVELEKQDDISQVRSALRKLPGDRQIILTLKYVDEMSTREISKALNIPQGTVKSRLYHAREDLKSILETSAPERSKS